MLADEELCLCFHVSCRKVIRYIERHAVQVPSQLSECFGAGTGCGWCRKQITKLVADVQADPPGTQELDNWLRNRSPSSNSHRLGREEHRLLKNSGPSKDLDVNPLKSLSEKEI